MLNTLKKAYEVLNGEKLMTFDNFIKDTLPEADKYKEMVCMHIFYSFSPGRQLEEYWVMSAPAYKKFFKVFGETDKKFDFDDANGKHSNVTLSWKECVQDIIVDKYQIYEKSFTFSMIDNAHRLQYEFADLSSDGD